MITTALVNTLVADMASGTVGVSTTGSPRGEHCLTASATARPTRPTHFVALRLPDTNLHDAIAKLQVTLTASDRDLASCAVPPVKTHLTAFVLSLRDDEVGAAHEALAACAPLVASHFVRRPPRVALRGLSSFGTRVLYADIEPGEDRAQLVSFVAAVSDLFQRQGLIDGDANAWQPHVTVLKTSRAIGAGRKAKILKIPSALWQGHADHDFGTHVLPTLQLCSMGGPVEVDGYYRTLSELALV